MSISMHLWDMAEWSQYGMLPCTLVGSRSTSLERWVLHSQRSTERMSNFTWRRFSLLLLEFGEIYFEDYSCIYYPNASTESESIERWEYIHVNDEVYFEVCYFRKERGRLKVCSRSLIFDPVDHAHPMLKVSVHDTAGMLHSSLCGL